MKEVRRSLKRGGGSSSSSSRSSRNRSYGNCYGDRCDDVGGDTQVAIIIGSIVGGCCLIIAIYFTYKHCEEKRRKARKKARKKKRGDNATSDSDSDMPKEPIVILPDDH